MDLAQSNDGGSHIDALKENAERERAANRRSHLGYHAFIDADLAAEQADSGSPNVAEAACEVVAEELNHEGNQ